MKKIQTVAAIVVVDLASNILHAANRENMAAQIEAISASILPWVAKLESQGDLSLLLDKRYPESYLVELWQLAAQLDNHLFGIELGLHTSPATKGILSHWVGYCDNLHEAFSTYTHHIALMNPAECWSLHNASDDNDGVIKLVFSLLSDYQYPLMAYSRSFVSPIAWGRYLSGQDLSPLEIELKVGLNNSESQDKTLLLYQQHLAELFACKVNLASAPSLLATAIEVSLIFNKSDLAHKVVSRNTYLKEIVKSNSLQIYKDLELNSDSYAEKIHQLFIRDLSQFSSIDQVCLTLGVSRSSLYRYLKQEQVSFSLLLDNYRKRLLDQLAGSSIENMTLKMGFNDVSSTYKFIQRIK